MEECNKAVNIKASIFNLGLLFFFCSQEVSEFSV